MLKNLSGKHKVIPFFLLAFLAGCQTASQVGTMSQSGMAGLTCDQINSAFSAYDNDRASADAWVQLIQLVRPEINAYAYAKTLSETELYTQAKTYTDIALAVKGCRPL